MLVYQLQALAAKVRGVLWYCCCFCCLPACLLLRCCCCCSYLFTASGAPSLDVYALCCMCCVYQDPALTASLGIDTARFSLSDTSQSDVRVTLPPLLPSHTTSLWPHRIACHLRHPALLRAQPCRDMYVLCTLDGSRRRHSLSPSIFSCTPSIPSTSADQGHAARLPGAVHAPARGRHINRFPQHGVPALHATVPTWRVRVAHVAINKNPNNNSTHNS